MEESRPTRRLVEYVPLTRGRRWITITTQGYNRGIHKQEEFKKGVAMLEHCAHTFRNPRLFHICFTRGSRYIYRLVMIRFCRALKAEGIQYAYKAAIEIDEEKGMHMHVMIVLGSNSQTPRFITSANESWKVEGESALRKAVRHTWSECGTLRYRVNPPKSQAPLAFIQFNQTNQGLFDEAVEWMSYIYKARSKPDSGRIYYSDRQEGPECAKQVEKAQVAQNAL
jgi:hypothetical protein